MSWAIWITGVPGSGKSALARAAAAELAARGTDARVLEMDEIRKTLTPAPDYSDAEREVVYRALVCIAALLVEAGTRVIIDATAHRRAWRELARSEIPLFAEVQLECEPELCRQRERERPPGNAPRGIYAGASQPGATVPGVNVPYERALSPELVIDTGKQTVSESARAIADLAGRLERADAIAGPPAARGWAVWITGRPGSGKSSIAARVAEAVAGGAIPVTVLEVAAFRRLLLPARASGREQEIAHRALVGAARLLTESGRAVIVDATAPRRAWREMARETIACFAEVQLICPADICMERERAGRWHLGGAPGRRSADAPDISVEYEESLRPDLALRTDLHDVWTSAEQVLFLIHRIARTPAP